MHFVFIYQRLLIIIYLPIILEQVEGIFYPFQRSFARTGWPPSRRQVTSVNIWHIRSMSHASCSICSGYPIRAARAHATCAWLICDSRKRLATLGISRLRFSSFAVAVPLVGNSRVSVHSRFEVEAASVTCAVKRIKLFFFCSIVTELYTYNLYISRRTWKFKFYLV